MRGAPPPGRRGPRSRAAAYPGSLRHPPAARRDSEGRMDKYLRRLFFLTINRSYTPVAKDTGNIYLSTITNSLYFITSRHEVARSTSDLTLTGASAKRDASPEEALMSRSSARSWEGKRGNVFEQKMAAITSQQKTFFFVTSAVP